MRKQKTFLLAACVLAAACFTKCSENKPADNNTVAINTSMTNGGFESQVKWGEHLVKVCGCNDCHTPKKMTSMGPVPNDSLMLSGHPSQVPAPMIDRKLAQSNGLGVTNDLTAWVGPWGISYAANLTPDSTGIANWTVEQFTKCLREGKWMGLDNTRQLLPPMPWQDFKSFTDDEIKALFSYLKSIPPIHNLVPQADPPVKM